MPVKATNISLNKNVFLSNPTVKSFLKFLAGYVSNCNGFAHEYIDRKSHKKWECTSVFDAYKNYSYPLKKRFRRPEDTNFNFRGFESNAIALQRLQQELRGAYEKQSEKDLLNFSKAIFDWGGVLPSNGCWLDGYADGGASIHSLYDNAKNIFTADQPDLDKISKDGVRSNAGFTKVYSLLFDDFIIYDSRVAAALGLFVIKYCTDNGLVQVPNVLDFNWMPPKEAPKTVNKKLRHATTGGLKFTGVNNNEKKHADSNIRSNWLLSELVLNETLGKGPLGVVKDKQDKMRALESAFFMIGYDLEGHPWLPDSSIGAV